MIFIFTEGLRKETGGPGTSIPSFADSLHQKKIPVTIFCPRRKFDETLIKKGLQVVLYQGFIDLIIKIRSIRNYKPEDLIFHINFVWQLELMPLILIGVISKAKIVINPRGMLTKEALSSGSLLKKPLLWSMIAPLLNLFVSYFQTSSPSEGEDLRNIIPNKKIFINPLGFERFHPEEIKDYPPFDKFNNKLILAISRIDSHKKIDQIVNRFIDSKIYLKGWNLEVYGAESLGKYGSYIDKKILRKLESYNIKLRLFVGRKEKIELLSKATFFISASSSESYGLSIAEALSLSTPVIIRNNTLWEDYIEAGCGFSFSDKDFSDLLASLEALDYASYSALVDNVVNKFQPDTWNSHTELFIKNVEYNL